MSTSEDELVREVVDSWPAAPGWWANVFISLGWTSAETRTYLQTASTDPVSPLRVEIDNKLGAELKAFASSRNLEIGGEVVCEKHGDGKVFFKSRQVMTLEDQELVLREVQGYARVQFSPSCTSTYADHPVPRVVRQVGFKWLTRMIPRGAQYGEVGANLVTMVLAGVDPKEYHGYVPVLGPRDSVRHTVDLFLSAISKGEKRGFTSKQQSAANDFLRNPSMYVTRGRVEDDARPLEYLISNHSDYDIDLDDAPSIMAKHNTRAWYGIMTRVKGLNSVQHSMSGDIPALGVRYVIDKSKDLIEFHFRGKSTFTYRHKFSSYVKREERNDYRWRGVYHDYVYSKLPMSTDSTLFYVIYRVRRETGLFAEPRYMPSGQAGLVKINSIRVVRRGTRWVIAPYSFHMEKLAIDKVLEYRRTLGVKGNVVSVLDYMRSVRVRFFLNGVPVGIEHAMSSETFESAAVFVEIKMAVCRASGDRDLTSLMSIFREVKADRSYVDGMAYWLRSLVSSRCHGAISSLKSWREALEKSIVSWQGFDLGMQACDEFIRVNSESVDRVVTDEQFGSGCPCRELREVNSALATEAVYSVEEREAFLEYKATLLKTVQGCDCSADYRLYTEFPLDDSVDSSGSETCVEDDAEEFFDCEDSFPLVKGMAGERADSVHEYIGLMRHNAEATRVESLRTAAMVFGGGVPTALELQRHRTSRCTPFLVRLEQGRLVSSLGSESTVDVSALVDVKSMQLVKVERGKGSARRDVKDTIPDGWHYSSSALRVYNGLELADAAADCLGTKFLLSGVDRLELSFVQGAFGCGKTRRIVNEIHGIVRDNKSVFYLSATLSSVDRVVSDLRKRGVDSKKLCRTMDSYLMNSDVTCDVVYVDEAPMVHSGQLIACLAKLCAKKVVLFGDFQQIPFCSFTSEFLTPLQPLNPIVRIVDRMQELHRVPYDTLAVWTDIYEGGLRACTCCAHVRENHDSLEVCRIRSITEVPKSDKVRYLTFTQKEKEELHKSLGFDVSLDVLRLRENGGMATVHEDQGGTHERVILVRSVARWDKKESPEFPSIYNKIPYVLVAMTRHKVKFSYYTVSDEDDVVCKRIRLAKDVVRRRQVLGE